MACLFGDKAKEQCARLANQGCAGSICPMYEDDANTDGQEVARCPMCGAPISYSAMVRGNQSDK